MNLSSLFSKPLSKVNCDIVQKDIKNETFLKDIKHNPNEQLIENILENKISSNKIKIAGKLKRKRKKCTNKNMMKKYTDLDQINDLTWDDHYKSQNDTALKSQLNLTNDNRKLVCYEDVNNETPLLPILNHQSKLAIDHSSNILKGNNFIFSKKPIKSQLQKSVVYDAIYEPMYESNKVISQMPKDLKVALEPCSYNQKLNYDNNNHSIMTDLNSTLCSENINFKIKNVKLKKIKRKKLGSGNINENKNLIMKKTKTDHCHVSESINIKQEINNENDGNNYINGNIKLSLEISNQVESDNLNVKKRKKIKNNFIESNVNQPDASIEIQEDSIIESAYKTTRIAAHDQCDNKIKKNRNKLQSIEMINKNEKINNTQLDVNCSMEGMQIKNKKFKKNKTKINNPESLLNQKKKKMEKKLKEKHVSNKTKNITGQYDNGLKNNSPSKDSGSFTENISNFIDPTIDAIEKTQDSVKVNKRMKNGKKKKSIAKLRSYYDRMQKIREKEKEKQRITQSKIGTIICKYYSKLGSCSKGDECTYKHEIVKIDEPCKYYLVNSCSKLTNCQYYHHEWPCKFYHIYKFCGKGNSCRFSHDLSNPLTQHLFEKIQQEVQLQNLNKMQNLTDIKSQINHEAGITLQEYSIDLKPSSMNNTLQNHSDLIDFEGKTIKQEINNFESCDKTISHEINFERDSINYSSVKCSYLNFYGSRKDNILDEDLKSKSNLTTNSVNRYASNSNSLMTEFCFLGQQMEMKSENVGIYESNQQPCLTLNCKNEAPFNQANYVKLEEPVINFYSSMNLINNHGSEKDFKPVIDHDSIKNIKKYKLVKIDNEIFCKNLNNIFGLNGNRINYEIHISSDPRLQSCKYRVQQDLRNQPIIFDW